MKNLKFLAVAVAALLSCSCCNREPSTPQVVVSGHRNPNILIVDLQSEQIVWQTQMLEGEQCNSLRLLDNNKTLAYSTQKGAKVVSIETKEIIYEYALEDNKSEVHSLCPRKDGGLSIFIAGVPARVIELSKDYEVIGTFEFDGGKKSQHSQFRQAIVAKNGNYLIPNYNKKAVIEYTPQGEIVAEYEVGGSAFSVREMENGNLIMGMGDGHSIVIYDRSTMSIIEKITQLEGIEMLYMSQVEEIEAGRIMVANWSGHNKKDIQAPAPQLFELNGELQPVWSWNSQTTDIDKVSAFAYSAKAIIKK